MKANYQNKYLRVTSISFILLIALLLTATSCRSKKKLVTIDNSKVNRDVKTEVFDAIAQNRFEFDNLSLRGACDYTGSAGEYSFTVNMRMQRDKKVWMSVSAFFIEAARILITEDSIHIINYLDKSVISRSLDFAAQYTGMKLTVGQIQDVLVGNSVLKHDKNSEYANNTTDILVTTRINQFLLKEVFHFDYLRPIKVNGEEAGTRNKLDMEYNDFTQVNNRLLPQFVNLAAVTNTQIINATIKYSDISTEPIDGWPFNIPAKYERK